VSQQLLDRIPVGSPRGGINVDRRTEASSPITRQVLDWPGVLLETGRNDITSAQDIALSHHYIGMNAGGRPTTLDVREARGTRRITLAPGSVWVLPAGDSITLRSDSVRAPYIRMTIDPRHVNRLLARSPDDETSVDLRRTYGIASPQLVHLLEALIAEADRGNPSGLVFVETLTAAVAHQLTRHAGVERPRPLWARGGLSPRAKRRVLELIDAKLDTSLTIDALAREVGLSRAHFARAFKETIGQPPHRYLLSLRLHRARHLLETPDAMLSDVALRTGFSDQAHFSRFFKREFGVTPGRLKRSLRLGTVKAR
jgi:AraC family transcriptional regulator